MSIDGKEKLVRKVEELTNKTILNAKIIGYQDYDDIPILRLTMTDGSKFDIVADYGDYTGQSYDEYQILISVKEHDKL
ncbi:MAG: hypothetical protein PHG35_01895 [Dehalococcoidales bacterium]|nr:hypothetical protein [Dehalococcoidales bacterium]